MIYTTSLRRHPDKFAHAWINFYMRCGRGLNETPASLRLAPAIRTLTTVQKHLKHTNTMLALWLHLVWILCCTLECASQNPDTTTATTTTRYVSTFEPSTATSSSQTGTQPTDGSPTEPSVMNSDTPATQNINAENFTTDSRPIQQGKILNHC